MTSRCRWTSTVTTAFLRGSPLLYSRVLCGSKGEVGGVRNGGNQRPRGLGDGGELGGDDLG